jgi:spore maturation protein CgeB
MNTLILSYSKNGEEGRHWARELASASTASCRVIPFNHGEALGYWCNDAWQLDVAYRRGDPSLRNLYAKLSALISDCRADYFLVTNDVPYHPDFLLSLPVYRAYYTTDDPGSTYQRTIPFIHAFHHLFHCAIPYSKEKTLRTKLLEAGARRADFLPLGVFDFEMDTRATEATILERRRDIDLIYVGGPYWAQKLQALLTLKKAFPRRLKMFGFWTPRNCVYFSWKARRPFWVRPVSLEERVHLYQRAKVGFNVHWDDYGLGNQRLYHLPANGVMQICDSTEHLGEIYDLGREVVPAATPEAMVEQARYYLENDGERERIALAGFRRVQRDYRIVSLVRRMVTLLEEGARTLEGGDRVGVGF